MTTPDEGRHPASNGRSAGAAAATEILSKRPNPDEPRWSNEHEQAVLGALLWAGEDWEAVDHIADQLEAGAQTFYLPLHGRIYEMLMQLRESETALGSLQLITLMTPKDFQRTQNGTYLAQLLEAAPTSSAVSGGFYARQVSAAYVLRTADEAAQRARQRIANATLVDAKETIDRIKSETVLLPSGATASTVRSWGEMAAGVIDASMGLQANDEEEPPQAISSGWAELDEKTGGFRGGQLIVIAARPGMGKTIAGLNIGQQIAMRQGLPFLWYSLEMSAEECVKRMLCAGAGIPWAALRDGTLSDEQLVKAIRYVEDTKDAPFYIDDSVGMTAGHIRSTTLNWRRRINDRVGGVGWDYLQLTTPDADMRRMPREQQVSQWSWIGKTLAREVDAPLFLLAQLNRGPEQRTDKKPQLGDLRESGAIEQNADAVLGLHREDYYDENSARKGEVDLCILKNRNGPTDTVALAAQMHMARFWTMRFE